MDTRWRMVALALVGLGWTLSAFLLLRVVALRAAPQWHLTDRFCPGCDSALMSGWQLGFPLAAWALIYYAVAAFLIVHGSRAAFSAAWTMSAAATGASLVLTASLLLNGSSDCLPCLAAHVINAAVFSALSLVGARQLPLRPFPYRLLQSRVALAAVLIVAGGLAEAALRPSMPRQSAVLRIYAEGPPRTIPEDPADPSLGAADSPVRIVVFSSFQCPGCQAFAHVLRRVEEEFAGRLTTVFKHFPLGKECNTALPHDLQSRSCAAAEAAEAAHRLGAFWRFHDALFAGSLQNSEDDLRQIARHIGLPLERWKIERDSPAVREKLRKDIELGWLLGVDATPAVFLNGRRVFDLRLSSLETLIRSEVAARGRLVAH